MDLARPYQSMFPTVDSAVLAALAGAKKQRTGRELARLAGRSQDATQRVLDRLVEHGLVLKEDAGRSRIYALNRDHVATPGVTMLVEMRAILFHRIGEAVDGWELPPLHLSIFGSAARGDGSTESDVDVFVVRPADVDADHEGWRAQIDTFAESIYSWSGNFAGISEVGVDELELLRRERPPVLDELERDSLRISGPSLREVLRQG
ncbi:MAG TPA: MarR family transcriptional regulator [Solirubrobacterales bacterium]|nr:MarR family transcriptional regulator [Solirubrobacterales bacterium]